MGFFSWKTQDTKRSIPNVYNNSRDTFKVIMTDDKGNQYVEEAYEGYGVFGGKDYYELLAEMNGKEGRDAGTLLAFEQSPSGVNTRIKYPSLSESGEYFGGVSPENCPHQGYFF